MTNVVQIRNLGSRYGNGADDVWTLREINLEVAQGEVVALVGGSGSGKTTLLGHVAGLSPPVQGEVRLFGESLFTGGMPARRQVRQRFGMLFQHGALFSALNVFDNIAFPLRELRLLDESLIHDLVMFKLSLVELLPEHAWLMPAELSGGMIKRVALARALSLDPELLLLDEPTAGLDPERSRSFVSLIRMLQQQMHLTVILATHDIETLAALATRVAVLVDQRILALGTIAEIRRIDHPFIERFFRTASMPLSY